MVTFADRSRVLQTPPAQPGSVIGRSTRAFGVTLYNVAVLGPEYNLTDDSIRGYAWSHSGTASVHEQDEQAESLQLDDWVGVGTLPERVPDELRLTTLPTELGSVIGRIVDVQGVPFYQIAVLTSDFDIETDKPSGSRWSIDGEDSYPTLAETQAELERYSWMLMGVVPPGDGQKTKAQRRASRQLQQTIEAELAAYPIKMNHDAAEISLQTLMHLRAERQQQRDRMGAPAGT